LNDHSPAAGAVVPLNVMLQAPEVAFHLSDSGARILVQGIRRGLAELGREPAC